MRDIIPLLVLIVFVLFASWLLRTLLENHRWGRAMAVHAEAHNRLLQRFESSQELLSYIESEPGRRFLESAPLTAGLAPAQANAIAGRALFSLQTGIVIGLAGAALLSLRNSVEQGHDPMLVIGSVALAVGVGFVLSAAVSIVMGRHLGLIPKPGANGTR